MKLSTKQNRALFSPTNTPAESYEKAEEAYGTGDVQVLRCSGRSESRNRFPLYGECLQPLKLDEGLQLHQTTNLKALSHQRQLAASRIARDKNFDNQLFSLTAC